MLTHEDFVEIKKILDDRYVRIDECNEKQAEVNKKFANDDKRLDMMLGAIKGLAKDISTFKKIGWVAISALIGEFVLGFLNMYKSLG